jgi:uncharacterized protein YkwD
MRTNFFVCVIALAISPIAVSETWAATSCPEYASRAVNYARMARGCFSGPRWSLNAADHLNWCRGKAPQQVTAEEMARRRGVRQCFMMRRARAPAAPTPVQPAPAQPRSPMTTGPVPAPVQPAPAPVQPAPVAGGLTSDQQIMLNAHNADRAKHCVPALTWSASAAAAAQQWASLCTSNGVGGFAHDPNRGGLGENRAWGTNLGAQQSVDLWYNEVSSYNFTAPVYTLNPQVGHFTQLVWRTTTQVGCAMARCGAMNLWVCRYSPTGNMNVQARAGFTVEQARVSLSQNVPRVCR